MSWLENIETDFHYRCDCGATTTLTGVKNPTGYEPAKCSACGGEAKYSGFKRVASMNQVTKVSYEKNGRLAYKIDSGRGQPTYMSQTKYNFLESGGKIEHKYAPGYKGNPAGEEV